MPGALRRAFLTMLGAAALLAPALGAPQAGRAQSSTEPAPPAVAVLLSSLRSPFFSELADRIREAAEIDKLVLELLDSADDAAVELAHVRRAIEAGVRVLVVNPVDSIQSHKALMVAREANIPVITVDREIVDGGGAAVPVAAHVTSDNRIGGHFAGRVLSELLPQGGPVLELTGPMTVSAARERSLGFREAVGLPGGLSVIAARDGDFERAPARRAVQQLLNAGTPTFVGVFAHNDEMAIGAAEALATAGKRIPVVGIDGTPEGRAAVETGLISATIAQDTVVMALETLETVHAVLDGRRPDPISLVPLVPIVGKSTD